MSARSAAIYGSGPAGLMAATILAEAGVPVTLFERRPSYGRKLLIAGSSGLNVSHHCGLDEFISHYQGFSEELWRRFFTELSPGAWIGFIERLGLETFVGTSSRYFVREMKASGLLRAWRTHLEKLNVKFMPGHEWRGFENRDGFAVTGLFLGGGSWEDVTPTWPGLMREAGIRVREFEPANVGYEVAWKEEFLKEAEGKPLKNIVLMNRSGSKAGELVVTRYGLEGTPIYFLGQPGPAHVDLKPSMSEMDILKRLQDVRENLSPIRRVKKQLSLGDAAMAMLFHHTTEATRNDLQALVSRIKAFPIELLRPRPLIEAISSTGGIDLNEVSIDAGNELALRKFPSVFVGGEMLDWTAPTGGFLIQGAVTQGAVAGRSMLNYLDRNAPSSGIPDSI